MSPGLVKASNPPGSSKWLATLPQAWMPDPAKPSRAFSGTKGQQGREPAGAEIDTRAGESERADTTTAH